MPEQTYKSSEIALEQLETALRLYLARESYFSVVTLAGAAEEIYGKIVRDQEINNSMDESVNATLAMHKRLFGTKTDEKRVRDRMNHAKNVLKHANPKTESTVTLDVQEEAIDMLNRAIDNYWLIESQLSPRMVQFQRERHPMA